MKGLGTLFYSIFLRILERIPKENKSDLEPEIRDRESLPLGALAYLHVGTNSGGSGLKPGTVLGECWVERGSSQVIPLIDLRSEFYLFL